jgi:serine protease AprX
MTPLSHGPTRRKTVWGAKHEPQVRQKATWGFKRLLVGAVSLASLFALAADASAGGRRYPKLDWKLERRAVQGSSLNRSSVIVTLDHGDLPDALRKYRRFERFSHSINGYVLDLPDSELANLANLSETAHVHPDADVHGLDFRTAVTSGSFFVNHNNGYTGVGVTVAVLDSGIASTHDDLPASSVVGFMDFVNGRTTRYDDYGHGTHVAGIIAGRGRDSGGQMAGAAPGAKLFVIKVLDSQGNGKVSNVIAALDWLADHGAAYGVRVVNLSFGAQPDEDPSQDPLAQAAQALVQKGIVVVAAAGNEGQVNGKKVWGGIGSPADSPWVLTVGASSSMGTLTRKDDTMAPFSSRGPAVGHIAKPDLVASGVGIVAPISSTGTMVNTLSQLLVTPLCSLGVCPSSGTAPYMSLSGTSMAAPAVSGAVALMLQANPNLTPNMVKAILQYTAEFRSGYSPLEQGAGFLNTLGAVRLAKFYVTAKYGSQAPSSSKWSRAIYWGNHRLAGGIMMPNSSAWKSSVQWGALKTPGGNRITWGTDDNNDNIIWGTSNDVDNIVWGTSFDDDNIVWGTACDNGDCGDNIIWGTSIDDDNIIWGTSIDNDNIVWGTSDGDDNIIWGTSDDDNIIWGTAGDDNIVWGTSSLGDNIVWGTADLLDNIVWGTSYDDNIIWGTNDGDNIIWGTSSWGLSLSSIPSKPAYTWFLVLSNDVLWIKTEFGDGYTVRGWR